MKQDPLQRYTSKKRGGRQLCTMNRDDANRPVCDAARRHKGGGYQVYAMVRDDDFVAGSAENRGVVSRFMPWLETMKLVAGSTENPPRPICSATRRNKQGGHQLYVYHE